MEFDEQPIKSSRWDSCSNHCVFINTHACTIRKMETRVEFDPIYLVRGVYRVVLSKLVTYKVC
jgi:hypothetical protein